MARCSLRNTTRTLSTGVAKSPCSKKPTLRRVLSTVAPGPTATSNNNVNLGSKSSSGAANPGSLTRQAPLTLLHKASKLLPQVLEYGPASVREGRAVKSDAWDRIMSNVYDDLSASTPRPVRLAVYGVDEHSGSEDFVTALLSNPLGSSEAQIEVLRDRWNDAPGDSLTISYGPEPLAEGSTIELPTSYLQQFPAPVELTELRASSPTPQHKPSSIPDSVLSKLYEADILILLCNPLVTSLHTLLSTPLPSNTILIVTTTPTQTIDLDHLLSRVPEHAPKPTIHLADPKRAADAITLLRTNPTSSLVVQRFQDAFSGSNVSAVTRTLESILRLPNDAPSKDPSDALRAKFALARMQDALSHCQSSLAEFKTLLNAAQIDASRLNDRLQEIRARVELDFLGPAQASTSALSTPAGPPNTKRRYNEVAESVRIAEGQMKEVMSRFTWWRMVLRVDEITTHVAAALQRTWCPELERKLLVHTGELHSIQTELTKASFSLLSKHRVLPTNVLRNSLLQLETLPQHRLTTNSLTGPIYARRNQIIEFPTTRLHVVGQKAVLGMSGGIVGGAGLGWVGWMGWLVGSGEGLLGSLGLEPATAMGLGALSAVASVRWAVGRWEKGKRKWWEDWRRVGDGLDRDLRVCVYG
ncbi:hypothetical protein DFP72DRAFT_521471 [Ephemerocybe angulata]|uniref:Uncharacterized protein n=1 Tax=Ephemerocybe angulata TaxID=980116 RepID=A0A8H6IEL5_9AGAR|nr:hypothetical protein DFP72DRAFT_521471 [Tulosesus angulatus]